MQVYDACPILCTHLFLLKLVYIPVHISTNCSTDIRYGVCLLMVLLLHFRPIKVDHDVFGLLTQCLSVATNLYSIYVSLQPQYLDT